MANSIEIQLECAIGKFIKINNKKLIFTDHLLMRLKIRGIKESHIYEVFQKTEKTNKGHGKARLITAGISGGEKLTVVYEEKTNAIIIITAYWEG